MSLLLIGMAIGLIPGRAGSMVGALMCAWGIAIAMIASLIFSAGDLVNVLPSIGIVVGGYNMGLLMGLAMFAAVRIDPVRA